MSTTLSTTAMIAKLQQKFIPEPMSGCWLWIAGLDKDGYGQFWYHGENRRAHRASYDMYVGPVSRRDVIRHTCDNPPCVNPQHLRLGTFQDNSDDRIRRGREASGERCGLSKRSGDEVIEIRRRYASGETQESIAASYGMAQTAISYIVRGETWRRVGGPVGSRRNYSPKRSVAL